jgi:SAM-dependent methyltransferase
MHSGIFLPLSTYDDQFFAAHHEVVRRSASVIVPLLVEAVSPASVCDVGCGTGSWLAEFCGLGVTDVIGVDGAYVTRTMLEIPPDRFEARDLNQPLRLERRFDLVTCLEVAEHLKPERSESLVADLVALAPVVCFGSAVPWQGGTEHINERWQDAWAKMFARRGYRTVDLIRPVVWDRLDVEPWYSQNTMVYAARDVVFRTDALPAYKLPLRVVHPHLYHRRMSRVLGSHEVLWQGRRAARRQLLDRFPRLLSPRWRNFV